MYRQFSCMVQPGTSPSLLPSLSHLALVDSIHRIDWWSGGRDLPSLFSPPASGAPLPPVATRQNEPAPITYFAILRLNWFWSFVRSYMAVPARSCQAAALNHNSLCFVRHPPRCTRHHRHTPIVLLCSEGTCTQQATLCCYFLRRWWKPTHRSRKKIHSRLALASD